MTSSSKIVFCYMFLINYCNDTVSKMCANWPTRHLFSTH